MLLHEIITINGKANTEIELSEFKRYKRSLLSFFKYHERGAEPFLMITTIFNAAQYGKIVHQADIEEAANAFLNADNSLTNSEREDAKELIFFNSIPLRDL